MIENEAFGGLSVCFSTYTLRFGTRRKHFTVWQLVMVQFEGLRRRWRFSVFPVPHVKSIDREMHKNMNKYLPMIQRRNTSRAVVPTQFRADANPRPPVFQLDTWGVIRKLMDGQLTPEQAEATLNSLQSTVDDAFAAASRSLVGRQAFEGVSYQFEVDLISVANEQTMLQQAEYTQLRNDILRLQSEAFKFSQRSKEELGRVQSTFRLDLSLEKGRIRDALADQEIRMVQGQATIDHEVGSFETVLEGIKWDLTRTLVPPVTGIAALALAFLRLMR
jgi:hypothetical protein